MRKLSAFQGFSQALISAAVLSILSIVVAAPCAAQDPDRKAADSQAPATQKPADSQKPDDDQGPAGTVKVNVNVVGLFFNVKDKHGALIPNLTKNDFEVYEDGKPQTIKYFAAESNLPLTLGILIDSSGSQMRVLNMEKEVGGNFLSQILSTKDLAFVLDFDVNVNLLQDFTNNTHLLKVALNSAAINTGGGGGSIPGMGGGPVPQANGP